MSTESSGTIIEAWRNTLLGPDATLYEAIRCLNDTALQIVIVISGDGRLLGTLTDGDIRRGLLRGFEMHHPIESIISREPLVVPPQWGPEMVLALMQVNKVNQLPVVDESRRVVGVHLLSQMILPKYRSNTVVIMAGGRGSRLGEYTEQCPKPLLRVGAKPMIQHIIERAKAEGFVNFTLCVHYLGQMIVDHFGDGSWLDVRIDYLHETAPLGTAGALGLLVPRPSGPFIVSNCDVLSDIRYGELLDFHVKHSAVATMAVRLHEWQNPFGVVKTKGIDIVSFEEKPVTRSHINAGIYVLDPAALDLIQFNEACDMPVLFADLQSESRRTMDYPMHEPWLDIGHPTDLEKAQSEHINT
jgi:dTDP-glucose pyrophosphorylase